MINIVIVSHSKHLADGVAELASQMINPAHCQLAVAAGVNDEEHAIGTDAVKIMTAIESLSQAQSIVVMMDLGSAILSAETAIELLEPELAEKVTLCSAPLVEGTLAAVVAASSGASLEKVIEEASNSLYPKKIQLGENFVQPKNDINAPVKIHGKEASWIVRNPHGLHVRPAATLVEVLSTFHADYQLVKGDRRINPLSLNQLSLIQIRQGDEITLIASGEQEDEAIAAFLELAKNGFGEELPSDSNTITLKGILAPVSQIKAPAFIWHEIELSPTENLSEPIDIHAQIGKLNFAIKETLKALKQTANKASQTLGEHIGAIFNGHIMMLDDDELITSVVDRIKEEKISAQQSWSDEMQERAQLYCALTDPYLRARELDLRDLRNQVLYHLQDKTRPSFTPSQPAILVAKELFPSTLIQLIDSQLVGIALAKGDSRSHSAIIAAEMRLPMLVNLGPALLKVSESQKLKLDTNKSELVIEPITL
ncbi:dihydroxyacetone kinase phosphoryl donor subunit DhaM [Proteus sp. FME41]|uniref:dihydroxyacetone kinase phosphoryl donor subunit DhaM n=1 Tax=Proteus sp. FME41 TaxID=2742608 RepID=UPI001867805E|nr:dihydroxyacetone kinase phosphoryl donor subunit DhaM [Proteus sp. FME41]